MNGVAKHAHWLLRLALASVFFYHGIGKFPMLPEMAQMMNLPVFIVLLVALAETVGSILIIAGGLWKDWMTRLGALMQIPVMLGAIFMVHWGQWNFIPSETHPIGGIEFQLVLLLIQLYFLIVGNNVKPAEPAAPPASA
jgi:putative oxidoreductase